MMARILEWDFVRLTVAHGEIVDHDAKTAMRTAWSFL